MRSATFDDLEQREIGVRRLLAVEPFRTGAIEHLLEVAEEFRHAALAKSGRALRGRGLLIFVVFPEADRVVRVVHLRDVVRDRQLQLMRPQPAGFVLGREPVPPAEKQQDVGSLADDELAGLEIGRRERNRAPVCAVERFVERLFAAAFVFGGAPTRRRRSGTETASRSASCIRSTKRRSAKFRAVRRTNRR